MFVAVVTSYGINTVSPADKLTNSNPAAERYLHQRKSVNNQEWLCKTCCSYLVKNKVPPVALLNGMQFPVKPEFFYLNELECRLLAPRLAFQKLMQAPRGKKKSMEMWQMYQLKSLILLICCQGYPVKLVQLR